MKLKFAVLLILAILVLGSVFGQKTKEIFNKNTNEMYEVLKSDKSVKHGYYKKYGSDNKIRISGNFKNGIEDSVWKYYNRNSEVIQKYDFNKKELIYFAKEEQNKNIKILLIDSLFKNEIIFDRPPLYVGGIDAMYTFLGENIRYPVEAQRSNKSGNVMISFKIDENGKCSNFNFEQKIGYGMDEEAMRILKELCRINWYPAISKEKKVSVEYHFRIVYKLD